jgi:hypothetical protein
MATSTDYPRGRRDFYDRREARQAPYLAARCQKTLERLGYQVTLIPPDPAMAESPGPDLSQEPPI